MHAITRSLAQAIPTATVREIDGAAHAVPFDAPGNFAQVIAEAICSSEVRSGTGGSWQMNEGCPSTSAHPGLAAHRPSAKPPW
jgi:hypothetical protein